ncbi:hypothetical protein DY000_02009049 [Brassica cretica]|uniref:Uncharacterized protein n=1 Tax=Brassica cretica TaxID=69181 RepID=A0ABQ7C5I9_BRACR|nr:hypothetical protein DY000_02009049 [Brassica cretica]
MIRSPLALLSSSYIDDVNPVLPNMPIGVRPSSRAEPSLVRSDALFVEPSKTPSHSLLLVVNCSIESASWAGLHTLALALALALVLVSSSLAVLSHHLPSSYTKKRWMQMELLSHGEVNSKPE